MTARRAATAATGRAARAEGWAQIVIMLAIGGAAGAASFTHVHNVAASHGQGGWLAWADAVVLELMSIASGLEMRHRRRTAHSVRFPAAVLVSAVVLSLSAQVLDAEPQTDRIVSAASAACWVGGRVRLATRIGPRLTLRLAARLEPGTQPGTPVGRSVQVSTDPEGRGTHPDAPGGALLPPRGGWGDPL